MTYVEAAGGRPCSICSKLRFPDELTFFQGKDYCVWCRWDGKWVFTGKPGKNRIKAEPKCIDCGNKLYHIEMRCRYCVIEWYREHEEMKVYK
jgi:hypothetical protein